MESDRQSLVDLQTGFARLISDASASTLCCFVTWLDEKVSEFKIQGSMNLDVLLTKTKWVRDTTILTPVLPLSASQDTAVTTTGTPTSQPDSSNNYRMALDENDDDDNDNSALTSFEMICENVEETSESTDNSASKSSKEVASSSVTLMAENNNQTSTLPIIIQSVTSLASWPDSCPASGLLARMQDTISRSSSCIDVTDSEESSSLGVIIVDDVNRITPTNPGVISASSTSEASARDTPALTSQDSDVMIIPDEVIKSEPIDVDNLPTSEPAPSAPISTETIVRNTSFNDNKASVEQSQNFSLFIIKPEPENQVSDFSSHGFAESGTLAPKQPSLKVPFVPEAPFVSQTGSSGYVHPSTSQAASMSTLSHPQLLSMRHNSPLAAHHSTNHQHDRLLQTPSPQLGAYMATPQLRYSSILASIAVHNQLPGQGQSHENDDNQGHSNIMTSAFSSSGLVPAAPGIPLDHQAPIPQAQLQSSQAGMQIHSSVDLLQPSRHIPYQQTQVGPNQPAHPNHPGVYQQAQSELYQQPLPPQLGVHQQAHHTNHALYQQPSQYHSFVEGSEAISNIAHSTGITSQNPEISALVSAPHNKENSTDSDNATQSETGPKRVGIDQDINPDSIEHTKELPKRPKKSAIDMKRIKARIVAKSSRRKQRFGHSSKVVAKSLKPKPKSSMSLNLPNKVMQTRSASASQIVELPVATRKKRMNTEAVSSEISNKPKTLDEKPAGATILTELPLRRKTSIIAAMRIQETMRELVLETKKPKVCRDPDYRLDMPHPRPHTLKPQTVTSQTGQKLIGNTPPAEKRIVAKSDNADKKPSQLCGVCKTVFYGMNYLLPHILNRHQMEIDISIIEPLLQAPEYLINLSKGQDVKIDGNRYNRCASCPVVFIQNPRRIRGKCKKCRYPEVFSEKPKDQIEISIAYKSLLTSPGNLLKNPLATSSTAGAVTNTTDPAKSFLNRKCTDCKRTFVCLVTSTKSRCDSCRLPVGVVSRAGKPSASPNNFSSKPNDVECFSRYKMGYSVEINIQNVKSYRCVYCQKAFSKEGDIKGHINQEHRDQRNEAKGQGTAANKCTRCGLNFMTEMAYQTHLESCKPLTCHKCHGHFISGSALAKHQKNYCKIIKVDNRNKNKNWFKCNVCLREFETKAGLNTHFFYHKMTDEGKKEEELAVNCASCKIKYSDRAELESHMNKYTYKCSICRLHYMCQSLIESHMSIHEDKPEDDAPKTTPIKIPKKLSQSPVKCKIVKAQEKKLLKIDASPYKMTSPMAVPFQCYYCPEQFSSAERYKAHVFQHRQCMVCTKRFLSAEQLHNHLKNHSAMKLKQAGFYRCEQCPLLYHSKRDCSKYHMIVHGIRYEKESEKDSGMSTAANSTTAANNDDSAPATGPAGDSTTATGPAGDRTTVDDNDDHDGEDEEEHLEYQCDNCGKILYDETSMRDHVKTHILVNDPKHSRPTSQQSILRPSAIKSPSSSAVTSTHPSPHTCTVCHKNFPLKALLDHHITMCGHDQQSSSHMTLIVHKCEVCKECFESDVDLEKHSKKHIPKTKYLW